MIDGCAPGSMSGGFLMVFHVVAARADPGWLTVLATNGETHGAAMVAAPTAMRSRAFPALFSPPRGASGAPSDGPWEHLHVTCDLIDPCGALNPDLLVGVAPQRGTSADDISTAGKSKALSRAVPRFWAHRLESSWQASNVGVFEFEICVTAPYDLEVWAHQKKPA